MNKRLFTGAGVWLIALILSHAASTVTAQEVPAHVVVVIEENHSYDEIVGNTTEAPYFNQLAALGAVFTNSHAIEHPSQPNYLDIYSGFNQAVTGDTTSSLTPFTTANLGAELRAVGKTFADYSDTLPSVGFLEDGYSTDFRLNEYERKHNPVSNWQNDTNPSANQLPSSVNQPFSAFPQGNFDSLPTVSFVIPNEQHDIHDGTISQGDTFLQANLDSYAQWAMTHNSLLIITFDENDDEDGDNNAPELASNQIPTIILGQNVVPGNYSELITHYNLLQTLQDFYGTAHAGATGLEGDTTIADPAITPITDIFGTSVTTLASVEFAVSSYTVNENAGTVRLSVKRVGNDKETVSVHYRTVPGPGMGAAKPGVHYASSAGTLSWAAGDSGVKTFEVKILDRRKAGSKTRTFFVNLTSPAADTSLGRQHSASVTIKENDPAPTPTPGS